MTPSLDQTHTPDRTLPINRTAAHRPRVQQEPRATPPINHTLPVAPILRPSLLTHLGANRTDRPYQKAHIHTVHGTVQNRMRRQARKNHQPIDHLTQNQNRNQIPTPAQAVT